MTRTTIRPAVRPADKRHDWSHANKQTRPVTDERMHFKIVGEISQIETIAVGGRIREIMRLRRQFGQGRWRKLKGSARIVLDSGRTRKAEVHWYEAHGIGKRKMKIKKFLASSLSDSRLTNCPAIAPAVIKQGV